MIRSPKIRALVVDDEPLARRRIRRLLSRDADVEVIGDCGNGYEAINAITEHKPDLLFLDVQMPEVDGFAVLEGIEPGAASVRDLRYGL